MTGFSFEGSMDNGGVGVNLSVYHVQGVRITKKTAGKSRCDGEGRIKYDGEIMRNKGDDYMVDCTMTGADTITPDEKDSP